MFYEKSLLFVSAIFVFCESAFVENLTKCKLDDGACQKNLIQSVIRDIAKTGVPELDLPQIDPVALNNISVSVLNVVDISLIKGTAKGIKDCVINKFITKIEDRRATLELTCDLSIKGQYKVFSDSPLVKNFFGGESIRGEGNGKVKIEKLKLRLDLNIFVERRNGELFFRCNPEKNTYKYTIGKLTFAADNLYIGKTESSKMVNGLLNDNWRLLMAPFGKPFMDKAVEIVYDFLHKFFYAVPTSYYITDDLSGYVKNE